MSEEKAIDILQNCIADYVIGEYCEKCGDNKICESRNEDCYFQQAIDIVLNLIEKQQRELDKKDKIIDLMAEMITEIKVAHFKKQDGGELLGKYRCLNKDEWIEYFTKKASEE